MCTFICNVFVFVIVIVIVTAKRLCVCVVFACPLGLAFQTEVYLFGFQNCISERIGKIMKSLNCHRLLAVQIER